MTISPNPISANATISILLPYTSSPLTKGSGANIDIFNLQGERVATLILNTGQSNILKYNWNTKNMASGVFLARVKINGQEMRKRILLTR
jgi:hypothetical protein